MNEHQVIIVTTLRKYEDDEEYFGCDGIFASEDAARKQIEDDIKELLELYPDAKCTGDDESFILRDGAHTFIWQIEQGFLPDELFQKGE